MFTSERPVWAEVDLSALRFNLENIKRVVGNRRVISVVKADAYGHGMKEVAKELKLCGVNAFAVAILDEACTLRMLDPNSDILVLGFTQGEMAEKAILNNIITTVFTYEEAEKFSKTAKELGKVAKIAVVLDTGMSRIGFDCQNNIEKSVEEIVKISKLPNIRLHELFSHFSTSDDKNKDFSMLQLERYLKTMELLKEKGVIFQHYHHANSAGIIDIPESHLDSVRPGIIQYGYYPSDYVFKEKLELKPVLTWKAKLVHIKEIEDGSFVSYGNTYVAKGKRKIGTIPLGYADGYSRLLSSKGEVVIHGQKAKVAGRICMDQFMVDLTEIENVKVGDEVTILGEGMTADDMAKIIGTISYEITCDIGPRVKRKYVNSMS